MPGAAAAGAACVPSLGLLLYIDWKRGGDCSHMRCKALYHPSLILASKEYVQTKDLGALCMVV